MAPSYKETSVILVDGSTYSGLMDTNTGAADGKGKRTFADGSVYEGDWRQGIMEGTGTMTFGTSCPSLDSYEGEWKRNKFHGTGTLLYQHYHTPNVPSQYSGEFKFGKMDGKGRRTAPRGEIYEGNWKEDKRHEFGIQKWSNGHIYEGAWMEDQRHGYGKETDAHGELIYVGDWQDNKYEGQGTWMPFEDAKDFETIAGVRKSNSAQAEAGDSTMTAGKGSHVAPLYGWSLSRTIKDYLRGQSELSQDAAKILHESVLEDIDAGSPPSKEKRGSTRWTYTAAVDSLKGTATNHQHGEREYEIDEMSAVIQSLTSELSALRESMQARDQQMAQLMNLHTWHKEILLEEVRVQSSESPAIASLDKSFRRDFVELLVSFDHVQAPRYFYSASINHAV
jgi:hypothetical protein